MVLVVHVVLWGCLIHSQKVEVGVGTLVKEDLG
jgi:hypothetical protein